jgi:hypothetical protein
MSISARFGLNSSSKSDSGPKRTTVEDAYDELPIRATPPKKRRKEIQQTNTTFSLEEMQASSPPHRPTNKITSKSGASSNTTKKAPPKAGGVFGGTVNKFGPRIDPSALSRSSSSEVNPARPGTTRSSGLEAFKDTMRRPQEEKVEKTAAELQFERDMGGDQPVLPVLSKQEEKERAEMDLARLKFFEEAKNRPALDEL